MRIKPTHLRAAAELLEGDLPDSQSAARAVIELIDRLRARDLTYTVVRQYAGPLYMGYGPFPTLNAALKAVEKGQAGSATSLACAVVPVRHPEHQVTLLSELDETPDLPNHHWARIHEKVTRS